jgi:integrase
MSRIKLTHSLIQQALPKEKPYALSDSCVPGLQLVVNPSGRKTFSFRSQNFRKALGIFPLMKVSASRREAIAYHEQHSKEIALKKRSGGQKNMMPLNSLIEEYFTFKQASLGAKTLEKYRYTWKKYASERLGSILISEITDTDINNLLMDLHQIKSCIKKLKLILVPAFRYARQRGHSVAPVSADNWMNVKSNSKERYFTCGELKSLFSLIAQRDENSVLPGSVQQQLNVFRLLVYTGCRVGEILSLQWKDVFLEDGYLQLWKTKTKKGRLVPLSDPLQKLMRNAQNHKINDYVFNSFMDSSNPMAHGTLTHTWLQLMEEGKFNEGEGERLCIHSLRHTFITVANRIGISPWTLKALVGHSNGSCVTGVYIHHNLQELTQAQTSIIDALQKGQY